MEKITVSGIITLFVQHFPLRFGGVNRKLFGKCFTFIVDGSIPIYLKTVFCQ